MENTRLRSGLTATLTILVERLNNKKLSGDERWALYLQACDNIEGHFRGAGWIAPVGDA